MRGPFAPPAIARAWFARLARSTTGTKSADTRGTSHTIAAPTASAARTNTIISTAIAEPSGQFCAPLNCEATNAPIMFPFAPPSTVAAT